MIAIAIKHASFYFSYLYNRGIESIGGGGGKIPNSTKVTTSEILLTIP